MVPVDLIAVEAKTKKATAELKVMVKSRGSRLMDLHGVGPVVRRTVADVDDIAGFADRNRFASWTGTAAPGRHRVSRTAVAFRGRGTGG